MNSAAEERQGWKRTLLTHGCITKSIVRLTWNVIYQRINRDSLWNTLSLAFEHEVNYIAIPSVWYFHVSSEFPNTSKRRAICLIEKFVQKNKYENSVPNREKLNLPSIHKCVQKWNWSRVENEGKQKENITCSSISLWIGKRALSMRSVSVALLCFWVKGKLFLMTLCM